MRKEMVKHAYVLFLRIRGKLVSRMEGVERVGVLDVLGKIVR